MTTGFENSVRHLLQSKETHLSLGQEILEASAGAAFPMDFLTAAVLNRSLALIDGFCSLIRDRNFLAATPLLRLQLDNALRLSAAWQVADPHDFVMQVLRGTHIRNIQDRNGTKLTDRHLVDLLSREDDQIRSVYEQTSAFVHLSDKHMLAIFSGSKQGEALHIQIGDQRGHFADRNFLEAVLAFSHCTSLVLKFAHGWAFTKANPNIATSTGA
jgi:hypothetical protein